MAKNKFYYNGKLVRTSDHEYTHCIVNGEGKVVMCTTQPQKALDSIINKQLQGISEKYWNKDYHNNCKAYWFMKNYHHTDRPDFEDVKKVASTPRDEYVKSKIAESRAWYEENGRFDYVNGLHIETLEKR